MTSAVHRPAFDPSASAAHEALLIVRVARAWLAVPAGLVEEVCASEPPTPVPRVPEHIPGLINLRGYAVPLLDLRRFLALSGDGPAPAAQDAASFARIVIVVAERMRVGLLCDRVRGVVEVEPGRQQPVTVTQGEVLREFACAEIDDPGGLIVVLDLPRLLIAARVAK